MEIQQPYPIYLDYKGYMIEPRSYRVMPAPLMGTQFATGRQSYSSLDFWQVGAMTDFTHGINQKFLVDPSAYFLSVGIDPSKPGQIELEKDLRPVDLPVDSGVVTARYRTADAIYLGTSTGKILKSSDGITFTSDGDTGEGKIYAFYEMSNKLFATKGPNKTWVFDSSWKEARAPINGQMTFTQNNNQVTGDDNTKFTHDLWPGCKIMLEADKIWTEVKSIESDHSLTLTTIYSGSGGTGNGKVAIDDLYFVMIDSDYGFGIFNDGIRRTEDGLTWIPVPPDPLWSLPSSEGIALNAISIPRGFLIGSKRGLWIFIGGSSGINLWLFPDYVSLDNFQGMDKWGSYAIFSVENQGIFYTDGSEVYPTNLNYLNEGFVFKSCKSIVSSGWDVLSLVSDGKDWYLARCNMNYTRIPKYWWLVKKLDKEPAYLASYSDKKVFVFYEDGTAEVYNKINGPYQTSGYLITSLIDENLIKLQKFYKSISAIFESFPSNTSVKLGYRFNIFNDFISKSFEGINQREAVFSLRNPTVENRIQIKLALETNDINLSPIVGDLCWTYILERPSDEGAVKKNFYFTIIAEDRLEKLTGDVEEVGLGEPRTREQILRDLWSTRTKKQLLNFVGADNKRELGLIIEYTGSGDSCLLTIDHTNYECITYIDGVEDQRIVFKDKSLEELSAIIDALPDYTSKVHEDQFGTRSANDLEPVKDLELKGSAYIYVGTDVHCVIFNPQSPGQVKLALEGRGSDRLNISLREA